jgi:hypothetical protein
LNQIDYNERFMANINTAWKRIMLVGCSHGLHLCEENRAAVLGFRDRFKPHAVWHLGDAIDTAAFRGGSSGSPDEAAPIRPDLSTGMQFLKDLGATVFFEGNHELRLHVAANHYNAIKAEAAQGVLDAIQSHCRRIKCAIVPYHIKNGWRKFGDYSAGHGYFFNEMACRDHAESFGNVVFAHTHKTGMQKGRRLDNPTGICVGTLADIPNMDYASTRRSTLAWNAGICWGYYNDNKAQLWLHEQNCNDKAWKLPV